MPVAIRAITRLQDADDANMTPGAGTDGYAIIWNNATAKFVLSAISYPVSSVFGRTGAVVAGIGDYTAAQVTNAAAVNAANTFTAVQQITVPTTTSNALVLKSSDNNATKNIFVAKDNFDNIRACLTYDGKLGLGVSSVSTGYVFELLSAAASIGLFRSSYSTAQVAIKTESNANLYNYNQTILIQSIDGNPSYGVIRSSNDNGYTSLVLNQNGGNVGIGTKTFAVATAIHVLSSLATTNAIVNVATIGVNSTGTAAAGFGPGLVLTGASSTTANQTMARIAALWDTATHASRSAALKILISNSGGEVDAASFDDDATSGNTRFLIYDVDKGALSRVLVGAADSGGTGYKMLRVVN